MNNCTEYIEKISAYTDGELSDDERRIIENHISECPRCAALLEFYGEISQTVDETCEPVPDGFADGVMLRVRGGTETNTLRLETEDVIKPPVRNKLTLKAALTRYIPAAACLAVILLAAPRLSGLGCKSSMDFSELSLSSGGSGAPPAVVEDAGEYDAPLPNEDLHNYSTAVQDAEREFMAQAPAGGLEQGEAAPEETRARDGEMTDSELAEKYKTEDIFAVVVIRGTLPEFSEIYEKKDTGDGALLLYITRETARALIESGYYSEVLDENSQQAIVVYVS